MDLTVAAGLGVAALAWAFLFVPGRRRFWARAAIAGLAIGAYGGAAQRHRLGDLLRPAAGDVIAGAAASVVLYGIFLVAARALPHLLPRTAAGIGRLYAIRPPTGRWYVPAVLVVVAGCEELFWRGLVQERAGVALALVAYAAVHLWDRNAALVLAAAAGGAAWAALAAWTGTLVAPVVCHALWDLAVVVWFPFELERSR